GDRDVLQQSSIVIHAGEPIRGAPGLPDLEDLAFQGIEAAAGRDRVAAVEAGLGNALEPYGLQLTPHCQLLDWRRQRAGVAGIGLGDGLVRELLEQRASEPVE